MADMDWLMAGIYLVGLVSVLLGISTLSARATMERKPARIAVRREAGKRGH